MKVIYKSENLKSLCNDSKKAAKFFGGDKAMATSLLARVNVLLAAITISDVIALPQMHFHKLMDFGKNRDYEGYFAIDVKSRKDAWRIIIELLDENEEPFVPCNIDEIANVVRVVRIKEVSKHYE